LNKEVELLKDKALLAAAQEFWHDEGFTFVKMKLFEKNLSDYIDELQNISKLTELPEKEMWHMIYHLALGLKNMEDAQTFHNDIKPDNIFLDSLNIPHIGDFGLFCKSDTSPLDIEEGDKRYLAREVLENEQFSYKSDVFSLGVVFFEMATLKKMPDQGKLWDNLRKGKLNHLIPQTYSDELQDLIISMIDESPKNRPNSDDILSIAQKHVL
ncbi:MAG: protein kinase, partial [Myxococcales bacterium]|nr:protein kinase [Myxococcales bacterium]